MDGMHNLTAYLVFRSPDSEILQSRLSLFIAIYFRCFFSLFIF
ncbi:hypothetical protein LT85_1180 [Collimonas arenae]|uniref:Uncharacterized protein n=1 Tax=Collimonas arenae TaxID=279058 RepID=A0A0A1F6L2_9BURK|nr:hypothetical protein LT85_1180 [Collimonas arenae]